MKCAQIIFSRHAFERMFERQISPEVVESVIADGDVVIDYPDDQPFPSKLLLGFDGQNPVHVVVARDATTERCHVVTVYQPDPEVWDGEFRNRRKP